MTIHVYDDTDAFDRDELDAVICLHSARQLIDTAPTWDAQDEEWAA
ncbi:hypothetical protein [Nocardia brasiliensis]|nr:hypothetical protein [Nocardia brasiliensis]SUB55073.1 Uncharacterised protein [Nocardia brasiliensis]